jgi:hypothetical protein
MFMQRSIIYMGICILSVTILLMVTEGVYSQIPPPVQDRVKPDTTLHGEKPGGDIVLGPVADSQVYMETYHDPYRIQNGVFLGRGIIGSETTFRQTESPFHFTGSLGVFSHDTGVRSDSYLFAGISAGREYLLNDYTFNSGSSRTELYVRLSPGVILVTDGLTGRDTGYYPGVTGAGITGAQYDLSNRTSIYAHGGAQFIWLPALNDIGVHLSPIISVGIQFTITPGVSPVRY